MTIRTPKRLLRRVTNEGEGGGAAQRRRSPASGAAASPRAVTRGESPATKIDWLNATFDDPGMSVPGLIEFLGRSLGVPLAGQERGGLIGFDTRVVLCALVQCALVEVGSLAFGGEAQRGRWLLQLTGKGSSLVKDWDGIRELLEGCNGTITRVDLACDFLDGEYSVDDAVAMKEEGGFNCSGREPSSSCAGDWLDGVHGRTLYVGKSANGKMLRVYEKGKEQGNLGSEWVRFEVQLGNRDRVIPFDVLNDPDRFFAGAYPALGELLDAAAEAIPTHQNDARVSLGHLLYHARRCYGKLFGALKDFTGATDTDLIEEMRLTGLPRRVEPAGVVAGLLWPEIQAERRSK